MNTVAYFSVDTGRGFSKRKIARLLGVSRNTVDKCAAKGYVVSPEPRMRLRKPRPAPKMDPWKPVPGNASPRYLMSRKLRTKRGRKR